MTADTDRLLARIARLEAQTDIRGRAVAIYQQRAREAKERIQAVEDALDGYTKFIHVEHIRAALETVAADIWDDAYNAGFKDSKTWDETGDTPNPYIQETR